MRKSIATIIILALLFMHNISPAVDKDNLLDYCEIDKGPCSRTMGERSVVLDINPKPVRAMRELIFTVFLKGGGDQREAVIDLGMPGMYMGVNRVTLKRESPGKYTGKGIIPRCPSGKRLWRATVTIADTVAADYLFNVTY